MSNANNTLGQTIQYSFTGIDWECQDTVEKVDTSSGYSCKKCKVFNEYSQSNQPDNTFICWACTNGY
jgi:hypothetical protein